MNEDDTRFATRLKLAAPDDFYADLIAAHEGLTRDESERLNARLVLLLANQVGDDAVVAEILDAAKRSGGRAAVPAR